MNILQTITAVVILSLAIVAVPTTASAQNANFYMRRGDASAGQGQLRAAIDDWTNAYQVAARQRDWATLAGLADRMLFVGQEDVARRWFHDSYAIAYNMAIEWSGSPGSGYDCQGGFQALVALRLFFNSNLSRRPMSSSTASDLATTVSGIDQAVQYLQQHGCNARRPVSSVTVAAASSHNSLSQGWPARGFGDSNQVDQWVPFVWNNVGIQSATGAKVIARVKTIGQLVGTDELILKGQSGTTHSVYNGFSGLPGNTWQDIEVDISGNADLMNAIRSGHLEGVIQDDTAVAGVWLVIYFQN